MFCLSRAGLNHGAGLDAAELALNGVRAEYEFGLRSTIEILIAEQSYRGASLALARSRSDALIAQAALLRAAGCLDRDAYRESTSCQTDRLD